jgi:hypothetical protein
MINNYKKVRVDGKVYSLVPVDENVQIPNTDKGSKVEKCLIEAHNVVSFHSKSLKNIKIEPNHISFLFQNQEEKIFLYMRRHFIENMGWILRNIFYATIPILAYLLLNFARFDVNQIPPKILLASLLLYYAIILTNVIRDFFDWYFDAYIVTNERVINFEFNPIRSYKVKEVMLQNIETVVERSAGIFANIFDYGTLFLSIEGPQEEFVFERISSPSKIRDVLTDLIKVAKKYYGDND